MAVRNVGAFCSISYREQEIVSVIVPTTRCYARPYLRALVDLAGIGLYLQFCRFRQRRYSIQRTNGTANNLHGIMSRPK